METMVLRIAELMLCPLGSSNIQLSIAVIGETHSTMELNGSVTRKEERVIGLHFGHSASDLGMSAKIKISCQSGSMINE